MKCIHTLYVLVSLKLDHDNISHILIPIDNVRCISLKYHSTTLNMVSHILRVYSCIINMSKIQLSELQIIPRSYPHDTCILYQIQWLYDE